MKTKPVFCLIVTLLLTTCGSQAQILSNPLPIVTVRSVYGASEAGGKGLFTVFRQGETNSSLDVYYRTIGTASNGVDYAALSGLVTIPVGSHTGDIVISPIDDTLVEGNETVGVNLIPPPTAIAPTYAIGYPSNALVSILDNDTLTTNHPPIAHILSPTNGATFSSPVDIPLIAYAADPEDGYQISVEFFDGTNSLGFGTFIPTLCPSPYCPNFALTWSNVPPGDHVLTARATDKNGAQGVSDPVKVRVIPAGISLVTVAATDPFAAEGLSSASTSNTGMFTIYRTGSTDTEMQVFYQLGGTASNGVDYVFLSDSVMIPAGASSANILVNPIDDPLVEGTETVELSILPVPCVAIVPPPPGCYTPGFPSSAVVFIFDNDFITNAPPHVRITSPTNGMTFTGPLDLPIGAEAADSDDDVIRVDFFANGHLVGSERGTNQGNYGVIWSNALPGFYLLQARALDSRGAFGFSDYVRIAIMGTNPPPPTLPPVVTIFAADPIAAEGTNWCLWYSNSTSPLPACFPTNTATFVVHRGGPTNDALTVSYAIGGTASNGVDYAALPGSVTIPAGERLARITILPIDDSIPECFETVILKLLQPTNIPPAYLVGWPPKAAAIIVDNDRPLPGTTLLCDGLFHLCVPATNGFTYRLECSLDLVHWLPVFTNTVTDLGVHFTDPESQDYPTRFYRVVPQSSATLQ